MTRRLIKLTGDMRGATALEYGLIIALIVIAIVVGLSAMGGGNSGMWGSMANKAGNAMPVS